MFLLLFVVSVDFSTGVVTLQNISHVNLHSCRAQRFKSCAYMEKILLNICKNSTDMCGRSQCCLRGGMRRSCGEWRTDLRRWMVPYLNLTFKPQGAVVPPTFMQPLHLSNVKSKVVFFASATDLCQHRSPNNLYIFSLWMNSIGQGVECHKSTQRLKKKSNELFFFFLSGKVFQLRALATRLF